MKKFYPCEHDYEDLEDYIVHQEPIVYGPIPDEVAEKFRLGGMFISVPFYDDNTMIAGGD